MKTENTLENKAKFFAQYWGQKIICFPYNNTPLRYDNPNRLLAGKFENKAYLELKPLSQISNEETEHVMELENFIDGFLSDDILNYLIDLKKGKCNKIEVIDYLRTKGYALPYMDLSVEDLIEYGWIKLEE